MSASAATSPGPSWRAPWVWIGDAQDDRNAYVHFRREFEPPGAGGEPELRITADTRYRAYLNGELLGEGPPPSIPRCPYYDTYPLPVRAGANCLAVVVHHLGVHHGTRAGMAAELLGPDGRPLPGADAAWRCLRSPAWRADTFAFTGNKFDPFQEFFDARAVPAGWTLAGFDDSDWPLAEVVEDGPWGPAVPRDIPAMALRTELPARIERVEECTWLRDRTRGEDLSIALSQVGLPLRHARAVGVEGLPAGRAAQFQCSTAHRSDPGFDGVREPCVVVDFGRILTAYVELEVEGPPGARVDVGVAERLVDGHFNNAIEAQFAARYTLTGGRQRWRTFSWRGFRYAKLRFGRCFEPLRLHAVRAVVTTYPFERRGAFACADERVNRIFEISRHTIRLCSHESIMDTPWREQAQWLGDVAAVTLGGIYACFGDAALAAKFLRQSAATQRGDGMLENVTNAPAPPGGRNIPDYSLWWVMAVWRHYLYTGDRELLRACHPVARRVIEAFLAHRDDHALVRDMPGWIFIDWANVETRGECTALNAILLGALEAMAQIARTCGDEAAAARADDAAGGIRASFAARLFDPARGLFADANIDGQVSPMTSEHANAAAIRFGLCDAPAAAEIARRLYEQPSAPVTEAQPFFTSVVLEALDRIGRFDLALKVLRERWGRRMVDRGATSTFEEWTASGSWRDGTFRGFLRSQSHAWSAGPAEFLIRTLAGIEVLAPGCRKLRVSPRPADFDYELTYPTPRGDVHVRRTDGRVEWSAPDEIEIVPESAAP